METKTKGKTGVRNEELFCFNCGRSYKINYPQPVSMVTAMMAQFAKDHEDCTETWKEPVNESEGHTEAQNAMWWAANGEHGMSSKTMFNHLSRQLQCRSMENRHPCTPSDPDDFKRCYKLLQAVPQWKGRLSELKTLSPVWEKLVDNWDKLTAMYEENVATNWKEYERIGMYELMKEMGC